MAKQQMQDDIPAANVGTSKGLSTKRQKKLDFVTVKTATPPPRAPNDSSLESVDFGE